MVNPFLVGDDLYLRPLEIKDAGVGLLPEGRLRGGREAAAGTLRGGQISGRVDDGDLAIRMGKRSEA